MNASISSRPLLAIAFMVAAVTSLSAVDAFGKAAVELLPGVQILFLRSVVILVAVVPFQLRGGELQLRTSVPWLHAANVVAWLVTMGAFYAAIGDMPLGTLTAIMFTAPLFMTALSVPMLGERVGIHRWAAIVVGLVGTLIVVQPGGAAGPPLSALLALLSAFGWAVNMVLMRMLTRTESNATVLIYANAGAVAALGVLALFAWRPVGLTAFGLVLAIAFTLVVGQYLQLRAFRLAPIGVVAPFQYFQLISATLAGWLVWHEWPASHVWAGAAVVVASGLYVIWREQRAKA
ncbi:MAG: DMT family transporter [Alphaproteobacteria bacterium]|nr:DMT family transporter [Alphaproteobacteria bacterium]